MMRNYESTKWVLRVVKDHTLNTYLSIRKCTKDYCPVRMRKG